MLHFIEHPSADAIFPKFKNTCEIPLETVFVSPTSAPVITTSANDETLPLLLLPPATTTTTFKYSQGRLGRWLTLQRKLKKRKDRGTGSSSNSSGTSNNSEENSLSLHPDREALLQNLVNEG